MEPGHGLVDLDREPVGQSREEERHGEDESGSEHRYQELPASEHQVAHGDAEHGPHRLRQLTAPAGASGTIGTP